MVCAVTTPLHSVYELDSCMGRVNLCMLRISAFAGQVRESVELCVRGDHRLNLLRGRSRLYLVLVRDKKFFVWVSESSIQKIISSKITKHMKIIRSKIAKHLDVLKLFASITLRPVGLQQ